MLELENIYNELSIRQNHQQYDLYEHIYPQFFDHSNVLELILPLSEKNNAQVVTAVRALSSRQKVRNMLAVIGTNAAASLQEYQIALDQSTALLQQIETELKK